MTKILKNLNKDLIIEPQNSNIHKNQFNILTNKILKECEIGSTMLSQKSLLSVNSSENNQSIDTDLEVSNKIIQYFFDLTIFDELDDINYDYEEQIIIQHSYLIDYYLSCNHLKLPKEIDLENIPNLNNKLKIDMKIHINSNIQSNSADKNKSKFNNEIYYPNHKNQLKCRTDSKYKPKLINNKLIKKCNKLGLELFLDQSPILVIESKEDLDNTFCNCFIY